MVIFMFLIGMISPIRSLPYVLTLQDQSFCHLIDKTIGNLLVFILPIRVTCRQLYADECISIKHTMNIYVNDTR